jgi:hypothetical protein
MYSACTGAALLQQSRRVKPKYERDQTTSPGESADNELERAVGVCSLWCIRRPHGNEPRAAKQHQHDRGIAADHPVPHGCRPLLMLAGLWQIEFSISNAREECSPLMEGEVVGLFVNVLGVAKEHAVCKQRYLYAPIAARVAALRIFDHVFNSSSPRTRVILSNLVNNVARRCWFERLATNVRLTLPTIRRCRRT